MMTDKIEDAELETIVIEQQGEAAAPIDPADIENLDQVLPEEQDLQKIIDVARNLDGCLWQIYRVLKQQGLDGVISAEANKLPGVNADVEAIFKSFAKRSDTRVEMLLDGMLQQLPEEDIEAVYHALQARKAAPAVKAAE